MKTIFLQLIILFACISITYSQQDIINEEYGFKITLPNEWSIIMDGLSKDPVDKEGYLLVAGYGQDLAFIIVVEKEEIGIYKNHGSYDLEYFKKNFGNSASKKYSEYKIESVDSLMISGALFYNIITSSVLDNSRMIGRGYFAKYNDKIYTIISYCRESEYEKYKQGLNDCISSFNFLK